MKKLLKLLKWVTVAQAAKHLSAVVGEEISEADILRLGIDGQLTLSVNFVNQAQALRGKIVPRNEAKVVPGLFAQGGEPYNVELGLVLNDGERLLEFDDDVVTISGVWDLPMIGAEVLDVEHTFQELTDGPEVTLGVFAGTFVQHGEELFQLQDSLPQIKGSTSDRQTKPWSHPSNFYPAGGLPKDAVIVVRTAELTRLQVALADADTTKRQPTEALHLRSEATYLTIIGAMLDSALGKSAASSAHSTFDSQAAIIDALLINYPNAPGISKSTLEAKFAAARRQLLST